VDPLELIHADIARSTFTGCARSIVVELAELAGGGRKLADQIAAEDAVRRCLQVLLQVRSSADFGAVSAKALRRFGRALGDFTGIGEVQQQLTRPYTEENGDPASVAAELDRLWRTNQEYLGLPQLPAGYWAQALAGYYAAAESVVHVSPLLREVRGLGQPRRLTVLPDAQQMLEKYLAEGAHPPRPPR